MKIGYPCVNIRLGCTSAGSFRLASYSEERLERTVEQNLRCLKETLQFNEEHGLLFFRISSDLVPFASHPVNRYNWQKRFAAWFREIGAFVRRNKLRISMHPDQFTLINSPDEEIFERSVRELRYHAAVLDLMELDTTAKIQIHIGGVYGDKAAGIRRFIERQGKLDRSVRARLVIENDDTRFTLADCLKVHEATGIPVIFDTLHHAVNNAGEPLAAAAFAAFRTWADADGLPMVDYSDQKEAGRRGAHRASIELSSFADFLKVTAPCDFDVMLEIKDKEASALKAAALAAADLRFFRRVDGGREKVSLK